MKRIPWRTIQYHHIFLIEFNVCLVVAPFYYSSSSTSSYIFVLGDWGGNFRWLSAEVEKAKHPSIREEAARTSQIINI